MQYEIVVHRSARRDVLQVYKRAAHNAPVAAEKWLARLQRKILTLQNNPQRCSFATEDHKVAVPLFELLFGRAPNVFRVIFTIAASALQQQLTIVTRNIADFRNVGVPLMNPFD